MDVSASSSLLLTPVASEGEKATFQQGSAQRALTGQPFLTNQIRDVYDLNLLPTPQAHDAQKGKTADQVSAMRAKGHGVWNLNEVTENQLLPTPCVSDSGNTPENHLRKKPGREVVTSLQIVTEFNMLSTGGRMAPASDAGNLDSEGQLLGQQNLLDEMVRTA